MTPSEAIQELDAMQRQIIHGTNVFGDIADVIRELIKERDGFRTDYELCRNRRSGETNL